ncbi:hypothetical protein ACJX0J_033308 [Zea mays]
MYQMKLINNDLCSVFIGRVFDLNVNRFFIIISFVVNLKEITHAHFQENQNSNPCLLLTIISTTKKDYLIEKDTLCPANENRKLNLHLKQGKGPNIHPNWILCRVNPALPDTNSPIVIIFHALGILESSWQGEEYSLLQIHESFDFMAFLCLYMVINGHVP